MQFRDHDFQLSWMKRERGAEEPDELKRSAREPLGTLACVAGAHE